MATVTSELPDTASAVLACARSERAAADAAEARLLVAACRWADLHPASPDSAAAVPGSAWSTTGYEHGEFLAPACGGATDTTRYLEDPAPFSDSGARVGDSFVWLYAVHPDVDAVRITSGDDARDLRVYEVDGAGYAPFEIPDDVDEYTCELIVDGQVVPGSQEAQTVPRR